MNRQELVLTASKAGIKKASTIKSTVLEQMIVEFNKNNNLKIKVMEPGTTGKHIQLAGLKVTSVLSGPLGGDAQIAAMIASNQIAAVVFLIDPLDVHPHQVDVSMLLRICNVHNIPLATNKATAEYLLKQLNTTTP